jgi:hypothetical protein
LTIKCLRSSSRSTSLPAKHLHMRRRSNGDKLPCAKNAVHCCQQEATAAPSTNSDAEAAPQLAGDEGYDVYVYEPQPLLEGEEKHMISVFVADESGLINRVAGVFGRRGALRVLRCQHRRTNAAA